MGPLGLGNGPAAMAGGFAPKGQRGQAPPAGPLLNAADAIADGVIGAIRARNAAGPKLRPPEAEAIRGEVAGRDSEKHKKNARDIDDLAKLLAQSRSLSDGIAIGRRLFGALGKGLGVRCSGADGHSNCLIRSLELSNQRRVSCRS
jgi:hypothetical protein